MGQWFEDTIRLTDNNGFIDTVLTYHRVDISTGVFTRDELEMAVMVGGK